MKLRQCLISFSRLSLYSSRHNSNGFHKTSTLNLFLTRQISDYGHKSDPDTMDPRLDHEANASLGMWSYPTNHEHCCIYRVPQRLRRVNPEAYTPQLVLIGPLHHYLKSQALESCEDAIHTKSMDLLNMDKHKKIYLAEFAQKFQDENIIDGFRRIIKANEETIRASYSESTSWIKSPEFVDMILHDSVFIIEHMLRIKDAYSRRKKTRDETDAGADDKRLRDDGHAYYQGSRTEKTGDLIVDDPCLQITIKEDLMLLENQLPYFILEKLFDPIVPRLRREETLRNLVLGYFGFFGFQSEIFKVNSRFIHFTDLLRCVRVNTLGSDSSETPSKTKFKRLADGSRGSVKKTKIKSMYNAKKLYSAGVKFVVVKDEFSIDVKFNNGYLTIPSLWVRDEMELIMRNIMALEQCHYPFKAYVCNFVTFLDFLIDSREDVDFLIEQGILNNWIGEQRSVAEMVNHLCLGIFENESYYADIASKINAYYECPINRTRAVLTRKYFSNLWTGTATVAATFLLVMTLIQTVVSVIGVL